MVSRLASALLFSVLSLCVVAKGGWGPCPSVSVVQNFRVGDYLGLWYEIIRTADMPFEKGDCSQAHYSLLPNGKVNVTNSERRGDQVEYAYGHAYCDSDGTANCHVRFSSLSPYAGYQVLDTDYKQYAVVFSCSSIYFYHWSWAWLLSRTPELDESYEALLQIPGQSSSDFSHTNQVACPPRPYSV